ncbi:hypothetical protein [Bacillus chungangensis]|uniref:Uncharacterized protein n=1 Tax=Bacillus chungangensis TaxID=587633 RepID=A0ABT9WUY1_9BACI|nr:hypothetical protein [Bacillus chungangensis]MDQ0176702.1 hypothetical protein [Bacillus chungangensis]
MNVIITRSNIQFKNPNIGQPTRSVEEHYNGRRITALIDGKERLFRIKPEEMLFEVKEADMIAAIKKKIIAEKEQQKEESQ